jgi:hypothetical protein
LRRVLVHVHTHLRVDLFGGAAQRGSRRAIRLPLRKKWLTASRPARHVHLAVLEPLEGLGRRKSTSSTSSACWNTESGTVSRTDAGDLRDDVVEGLEMLDVHGRVR